MENFLLCIKKKQNEMRETAWEFIYNLQRRRESLMEVPK